MPSLQQEALVPMMYSESPQLQKCLCDLCAAYSIVWLRELELETFHSWAGRCWVSQNSMPILSFPWLPNQDAHFAEKANIWEDCDSPSLGVQMFTNLDVLKISLVRQLQCL